ncbi:MAG: S9 family peptidase [Deltaproteobacteria bacterium]|nr:S9 family peptidase [Deltaproteobacteria bacterium]
MNRITGFLWPLLGLLMLAGASCSRSRPPAAAPPRDAAVAGAAIAPTTPRPPYTAAQLANVVEVSEVALSPDGKILAWATDRTGSFELWTAAIADGVVGAARQRTFAKEMVSQLTWSSTGDLLFAMDRGGDERNDFWILRRGSEKPERLAETKLAENDPRFSPDGKKLAFVADPGRPFRFNLHLRDLATGATRQLTRERVNVQQVRWSRDGKTLVATVTPDYQKGELLVVPLKGPIARVKPPCADGILWAESFLRDGKLLATATNPQGFLQLCTVDLATKATTFVGPGDWDVEQVAVADDDTVLFARNLGGESEILLAPGGRFDALRSVSKEGVVAKLCITPDASRIAFVRETSTHPTEILLAEEEAAARVVVPAEVGTVELDELRPAERFTYASFDGRRISAWVWAPPVARLGTPPPAVVRVHGGPNDQMRPYFLPPAVALAEAGFLVVAPNYRGSIGYGREFEDLNNKDWGGGDLKDLLAAVDALAQVGRLDPQRVGITGGSYGGYMTLRAITAAPERWAAAVEMYGMPDLVEDYKLTVDRFGSWYETEMGTPETHAELYRERSPIHFLDRIRTPLLVFQGENDTNVPKAESALVVDAIEKRGGLVEYTVYANEGHGFTHRENRLDVMTRSVEFFGRHLAQAAAAKR